MNTNHQTQDRIKGRKLAEEILDLALSESDAKLCEDGYLRFWQTIQSMALNKCLELITLPACPVMPVRQIDPMTDQQAAAFREEEMPFGKWKGKRVGWMMSEEPGYLLFLADAPNHFQQELKRFLAHPEVKRLTQPEE